MYDFVQDVKLQHSLKEMAWHFKEEDLWDSRMTQKCRPCPFIQILSKCNLILSKFNLISSKFNLTLSVFYPNFIQIKSKRIWMKLGFIHILSIWKKSIQDQVSFWNFCIKSRWNLDKTTWTALLKTKFSFTCFLSPLFSNHLKQCGYCITFSHQMSFRVKWSYHKIASKIDKVKNHGIQEIPCGKRCDWSNFWSLLQWSQLFTFS